MKRGRWRTRPLVAVIAGFLAAVILGGVAQGVATPTPVLTGSAWQGYPSGDGDFFSWAQMTRKGGANTFAVQGTGSPFKVNRRQTQGWGGGISGTTLVYQVVAGQRRDLVFYDLATRHEFDVPQGVNTKYNETLPSVSGDWLLFSRNSVNVSRRIWQKIVLFNLSTGERRILASVKGKATNYLYLGQVAGDYAVWDNCVSFCRVVRYKISTGAYTDISPPVGEGIWAGSVAANGDTYYYHSFGKTCDSPSYLARRTLAGAETLVAPVPTNRMIWFSSVAPASGGNLSVYLMYTPVCGSAFKSSDVYKVTNANLVTVPAFNRSDPAAPAVNTRGRERPAFESLQPPAS